MPTYLTNPEFKVVITHGGTDYTYTNRGFSQIKITRRENGWDIATLLMDDPDSAHYGTDVDAEDAIAISVKGSADATYTTLFDGVINAVLPALPPDTVLLKCDGAGYGLAMMLCGEEYGAQSSHTTLDTMKEIITDSTYGIVPKWLNKILGSATDSGYSYSTTQGVANDLIEAIAGTINYLYFPYKPVDKALNDLCDLTTALQGGAAGPHWIVTTDSKLIVSTIGGHHAAAVTAGWNTYLEGSLANATLVQGRDFEVCEFQKLAPDANYILYYGKLKKPPTEAWTENASADWAKAEVMASGGSSLADDAVNFVVPSSGGHSIKATSENNPAGGLWFYYPGTGGLNLDLTSVGGEYNVPTLCFYAYVDANVGLSAGSTPQLNLVTGAYNSGDDYTYTLGGHLVAGRWVFVRVPVGPYAQNFPYSGSDLVASPAGAAEDWSDIDVISFGFTNSAANAVMNIDGLHFSGWVLRGAKQSGGYSSADPVRLKVIHDDEAKDDTLRSGTPGTTDTGTMAQLCYAEYLRGTTTPLVGKFQTQMIPALWPGMFVHIHAKKQSDGSFGVDSTSRVTQMVHSISSLGYFTEIHVSDDSVSSIPRSPYSSFNRILADARPEFQDRQSSSMKMRDIDITQAILEESY